jgi:alpha-1,3-glucosyltransferase
LHLAFYLAMISWHILEAFVPPPAGKPDFWVVLNALIGAAGFGLAYLWCMWNLAVQCREIELRAAEASSQKKEQ